MATHNPNAGSKISFKDAKKMTDKHKEKHPDGLQSYYFGRENFERLLAVPGCAGLHIFNGIDDGGNSVKILAAADVNGQVIATAEPSEQGQPCPPFCNPLPPTTA